ncbi:hypothetical protein THAOC_06876, partial [Thalassiosira oceanica]
MPMSRMKKSTSMLEMNELHDVITFGEDMQALAQIDEEKAVLALSADDDDDGFFLADLEEINDPTDLTLSTSPDCVALMEEDLGNNVDAQDESEISSTLQRANSMACLQVPEKKFRFRLASSASSALTPRNESTKRPPDRPRPGSQGCLGASGHSLSSTFKSVDSSDRLTRNVSFSSIEIRSYARTMGDIPTTNGIPVQLDWKYDPNAEEYSVDDWESYREEEPRRNKLEMHMPASHRKYLLMRECGFTRGEIMTQMEIVKKAAKDRHKTISSLKFQSYEEKLEKTRRMFGKLSRSTSSNTLNRSTSSTHEPREVHDRRRDVVVLAPPRPALGQAHEHPEAADVPGLPDLVQDLPDDDLGHGG